MLDLREALKKNGIKKDDYWALEAHGVEWVFVLTQLQKSLEGISKKEVPTALVLNGPQQATYLFKKSFMNVSRLARATGLPIERIENAEVVVLMPPKDKGLPEPTVEYWGVA